VECRRKEKTRPRRRVFFVGRRFNQHHELMQDIYKFEQICERRIETGEIGE